jgi:hypothetical protein
MGAKREDMSLEAGIDGERSGLTRGQVARK